MNRMIPAAKRFILTSSTSANTRWPSSTAFSSSMVSPDFLGSRFPLILLDGLTFDLYQDLALASTQPLKLTAGLYEGEWQFTASRSACAASHILPFPMEMMFSPAPVTRDEDHAQYAPAVEAFLRDNAIENTPYVISTVLTGDFLDNGQTGAIVAAADSPLNSEAQPYRDQIQRDYWPPKNLPKNGRVFLLLCSISPTAAI